ncbi:hypothetical protein MoryE10_32170 [Methylogaea oryzae]|uniref:Uncharacterized protein n=1 Tax=Methylogaea oryzae TaxID=1295382 RepID=A0A8D5AJP0_9GAMM|nr:hypothetical protein MoryE10_32170 [Methylogaea oryzae]
MIYAIGGGHGHARRGWLLQQRWLEAGRDAVLLVRPGSDRHLPASPGLRLYAHSLADAHLDALRRRPPRRIVVDTFPSGWRGELDASLLGRFQRRAWIARYGRGPAPGTTCYDRVIAPYPAQRCEWGGELDDAAHAGYLIEAGPVAVDGDAADFTLLDPEGRCSPHLLQLFARLAQRAGLGWRHQRRLAPHQPARKLLVVGAGYHTFYELLGVGADLRFLPVHKRHDDQFRRADLFGLALNHLEQVLPWLAAPFRPVAEDTAPRWHRALALLEE